MIGMAIPSSIGRFEVVAELGRGSQGVVYLAEDPRSGGRVAVKTLELHLSRQPEQQARLMQEARTVSRLQHPNIVPLYDAGGYDGKPYLVSEYVEGISLRRLIVRDGAMAVHRAVGLMKQILDAIAYAHEQGVVHAGLNTSDILMDNDDTPRIKDFGVAAMTSARTAPGLVDSHTSLEHILQSPVDPRSDTFSLGLIFYEMLTGQPPFPADSPTAMLDKIDCKNIEPPSRKNKEVRHDLDGIVMKALEKSADLSFAGALEMKQELEAYLSSHQGARRNKSAVPKTHSTVDFLLRRIRHKQDFPAFAHHIIEINQKASALPSNYVSASELANVILKDYSLTNKLLKLVNSAFFGQFSGKITTVSRAVVVLGFERIRMAATGLILFEHLQNKAQTAELKDAAVSSFMSGLIARNIAENIKLKVTEEAFICAMLHNLGKHLVIFYFPEEYKAIKNRMKQNEISEGIASRAVLGIPFEEVGIEVLRAWNFPDVIITSMHRLPAGTVEAPKSEDDILRGLSNLSNELCDIVKNTIGPSRQKAFTDIAKRYQKCVPISVKEISGLLISAGEQIEKYSDILKIDLRESELLQRLIIEPEDADKGKISSDDGGLLEPSDDRQADQANSLLEAAPEGITEDHLHILINGIQEITNVLLENYDLSDIMFIILETMYRGFGFNRVIFCMLDRSRTVMSGRFGFGEDIQEVLRDFSFKPSPSADVFSLAVLQGKDFLVGDCDASDMSEQIPQWYRKSIAAPAFILYPLTLKNVSLGLFYADREHKGPVLSPKQMNYMKTLRNQAILAVKQKL